MKTFCNTFPLSNGVFTFYVDGRQFILCYYEQKLRSSVRTCERRCNQFVEHLLMETIGDATYLTYNVSNFSDSMWNLWWTK
jgi:hypothetical protein